MSELLLNTSLAQAAYEQNTMGRAGLLLTTLYPGYAWGLSCRGGVLNIQCGHVHSNKGMTINLNKIYSASELDKKIRLAGGELLERARLATKAIDYAKYRNASKDLRGNILGLS